MTNIYQNCIELDKKLYTKWKQPPKVRVLARGYDLALILGDDYAVFDMCIVSPIFKQLRKGLFESYLEDASGLSLYIVKGCVVVPKWTNL
jgi:hypothetical protein